MATQTMESEYLGKTFLTAILITGNFKRAEAAVLDAIQSTDLDVSGAEELLRKTAASAIRRGEALWPDETEETSSFLPVELRRVLRLPRELRWHYVLRMLMAVPRECCARLLNVDVVKVDQYACLAAAELARPAGDSRLPLLGNFA